MVQAAGGGLMRAAGQRLEAQDGTTGWATLNLWTGGRESKAETGSIGEAHLSQAWSAALRGRVTAGCKPSECEWDSLPSCRSQQPAA